MQHLAHLARSKTTNTNHMNFAWMVLYNVSSPGGHIYSMDRNQSLCGIEKRFPMLETEVHGIQDGEFDVWWRDNKEFCCRRCAEIYRGILLKQ